MNQKCLESERKCVIFSFMVVVLIMIIVTLHCYYDVLTLPVWVQFSNGSTNEKTSSKLYFSIISEF